MSRQPNRRRSRRVVFACVVLMLFTAGAERDPCFRCAIVLAPLGMPRVLVRVLLFVPGLSFDVAAQHRPLAGAGALR